MWPSGVAPADITYMISGRPPPRMRRMDATDGLERLWTPHRMPYITGENAPAGCPLCLAPDLPEPDTLVVARGVTVFAVLNLYPYNPGHLMVCPYRHVADYTDLTEEETVETAAFTRTAMR